MCVCVCVLDIPEALYYYKVLQLVHRNFIHKNEIYFFKLKLQGVSSHAAPKKK